MDLYQIWKFTPKLCTPAPVLYQAEEKEEWEEDDRRQ